MSYNLRELNTEVYYNDEKISIDGNIESMVINSGDKKFNISFSENGQIIAAEIKKDKS